MMRMHRSLLLVLALFALACTACGDNEPHTPFDPTDLPEGTATEGWGIGDIWYKYNFSNHNVTSRPVSWVALKPNATAYFFHVRRYYGPDGKSANPTLEIARWNEDSQAFDPPVQWVAEEDITKTRLCLDFESAETVPCDGNYDILWRTDRRPVPEIILAPANPGIYVDTADGTEVYQYATKTPPTTLPTHEQSIPSQQCASEHQVFEDEDEDEDEENDEEEEDDCVRLPWRIASAFDVDATPLVTLDKLNADKSVFQLTSNFKLIQWHAQVTDNTLTIRSRCVNSECAPAFVDPFDQPAQTLTIDLNTAEQWTFLSLCELNSKQLETIDIDTQCAKDEDSTPCVTHTQEELRAGAWPDNRTFDVVVQTLPDEARVWIAPSQPIKIEETTVDEDTTVPRALWSLPDTEVCD